MITCVQMWVSSPPAAGIFFCRRRQAAPPAWLIMLKFTEGGVSGPHVGPPSTSHTLVQRCSALLLPGWCLESAGARTLSRWQQHAGIVDYKNANGRNGRGICCTSDTIDLIGGGQRRPRQGGAPCFSAQRCSRTPSPPATDTPVAAITEPRTPATR